MALESRSIYLGILLAFGTNLLLAWPAAGLPEPPGEDMRSAVAGNTEFALDLHAKLRTENGNVFLSPYSISTALAMTYAGAQNDTAKQMEAVLRFPLPQDRLHPAFAELESSLQAAGGNAKCILHVANALWGQQGHGFLDEFLALNRKHHGAGLREVDFERASEQARLTINAWTAEQTQQMIKELLRKPDLDSDTVLVLTNAIYFKGDWASRFDRRQMQDGPFRISKTDQVIIPMMHQLRQFPFAACDDLDLIELPYAGGRLSMVILLPKRVDGLPTVEAALTNKNFGQWLGRLRLEAVQVSLPRFKLAFKLNLARTLASLGMPDAFTLAKADFSGMAGGRGLFISKVIHQAKVDVNEEGTEAAAATAVVMSKGPRPAAFVADHPFIFLIRDKQTNSTLFLGRVVNPNPREPAASCQRLSQ